MDFCCESLGTSVTTSQVSSDGYEVTNLIASNFKLKSAGFIAERFIKPPVDITFTLPCEVHLNYIHLITSVGNQRSIGIDLYSFINVPKHSDSEGIQEVFLGKCFIQSEQENQIVFTNRTFNCRAFYNLPPSEVPKIQISQSMKLGHMAAVTRVAKIKIRLWKTTGGGVPALAKVVINGIPSRHVSKDVVQRLLTIVNAKRDSAANCLTSSSTKHSGLESSTSALVNARVNNTQANDIPDDFLDALTYELMSYPLVLPSGNTVDQTTLDKHVSTEAAWGRLANDPFTGVLFNSERRPVPNVALKSRIDQFLLKNSHLEHETLVNGRTTGKRKREDVFSKLRSCSRCKTESTSTIFYRLACEHEICRTCLQNGTADVQTDSSLRHCDVCKTKFQSHEVRRIH